MRYRFGQASILEKNATTGDETMGGWGMIYSIITGASSGVSLDG